MNFTHLVGNTPMIRIRYRLDGQEQSVWAKLEAYNLSGSIKDRLAAHVIAKSTANGTLKPGQPIVEIAGDRRVLIENHFGVKEYSREKIGVKVKYGLVCVCGCDLELIRMTKEQLIISGRIDAVTLIRRG